MFGIRVYLVHGSRTYPHLEPMMIQYRTAPLRPKSRVDATRGSRDRKMASHLGGMLLSVYQRGTR